MFSNSTLQITMIKTMNYSHSPSHTGWLSNTFMWTHWHAVDVVIWFCNGCLEYQHDGVPEGSCQMSDAFKIKHTQRCTCTYIRSHPIINVSEIFGRLIDPKLILIYYNSKKGVLPSFHAFSQMGHVHFTVQVSPTARSISPVFSIKVFGLEPIQKAHEIENWLN